MQFTIDRHKTMTTIQVEPCQILPLNFTVGDVLLEHATGDQFAVADVIEGVVSLRKLRDKEKSKAQYLDGTVVLFDESDFREPGIAEPDAVTIVSQIQGMYKEGDPEDFYASNYVPGLP